MGGAGWAEDYFENERFGETHAAANANRYNPTKEEIQKFQIEEAKRLENKKTQELYENVKDLLIKDGSLINSKIKNELDNIYLSHERKMKQLEVSNENYINIFLNIQELMLSNSKYTIPSISLINKYFSKIKETLIKNDIDYAATRTMFRDDDAKLGFLKISSSPYIYTDIYQLDNNTITNKKRFPDEIYFNKANKKDVREDYYSLTTSFQTKYNFLLIKNDNLYITKDKYSFESILDKLNELNKDKLIKILELD